jgi:hypothetical protein
MAAFDHVTPEHARRLARADVIGAVVMLGLLGGCFAFGVVGHGNVETHADERPMGILIGLVVLVPYGILLLAAAGLLRRWPRAGYVAHVLAWNWPFILVIGAAMAGWLIG